MAIYEVHAAVCQERSGATGTTPPLHPQNAFQILALCVAASLCVLVSDPHQESTLLWQMTTEPTTKDCAICFFGLPRAFESLVLPSLIRNVIPLNDCDYYVHYYHQTSESAGRSGAGGTIDPNAIRLLEGAVKKVHPDSRVIFSFDTEEEFWKIHGDLVERTRTAKDANGQYLYFPWKARTYRHPVTTDNILKMWHSVQRAFLLIKRPYKIAAMLRSDVVYVTPIDVHDNGGITDKTVTVPGFGLYPVSDRIAYGDFDGVREWATARFSHLESHVESILQNDPGWGMHSERFMNYTIWPLIQNHAQIRQDESVCFLRARADETVWVSDCTVAPGINMKQVVEMTLGRLCHGDVQRLNKKGSRRVRFLNCTVVA